jgi:hypothetical protein
VLELESVPQAMPLQDVPPAGATFQVTPALAASFATVALNSCTPVTNKLELAGVVEMEIGPVEALIVMLKARVTVCAGMLASVACTVKLLVPAVAGVPEICPLAERFKPAGSVPEMSDQL